MESLLPMRIAPEFLLLLAAAIWGFAFVAQVQGMAHVGPFTFNGTRFALGALSLLPLWWMWRRQRSVALPHTLNPWLAGLPAGLLLFAGASLQQVGLLYTTAANAGFITGLYIILVPLLGMFLGQRPGVFVWLGAIVALTGLYALSIRGSLSLSLGDSLQLAGAFFWAAHLLLIGHLSQRTPVLELAITQYVYCAALCLLVALLSEAPSLPAVLDAGPAIAYAGILSVGVAYTLQVYGQVKVPPTRAAVIISLEAVFAALGGWWLLNQPLDDRALAGCALMLAGMIIAQWPARARGPEADASRAADRGPG